MDFSVYLRQIVVNCRELSNSDAEEQQALFVK